MCSVTYFVKVSARVSLKVVTNGILGVKISENSAFLRLFSRAKKEKCNQKKLRFSLTNFEC